MESPLTNLSFKRCFHLMLFMSYPVKCGSRQGLWILSLKMYF